MAMYRITKEECERLAVELQELIMRIFENDSHTMKRLHTEAELKRLDEISGILKDCEIVG